MSSETSDDLRKKLGLEAQAHQAAVDAVDAAAAAYLQVNRTDLRCLEILTQNDSVLPSQLAVQLGLTTGSVTAMLDRLERLGYVTRSADPADRRKVVVRITPKATRKAAKIYGPIVEEGGRDVLSRYSAAELHVLLDYHRRSRQLQEHHAARIRQLKS
jgi:DNA-binding MarR family transcriptional regulator